MDRLSAEDRLSTVVLYKLWLQGPWGIKEPSVSHAIQDNNLPASSDSLSHYCNMFELVDCTIMIIVPQFHQITMNSWKNSVFISCLNRISHCWSFPYTHWTSQNSSTITASNSRVTTGHYQTQKYVGRLTSHVCYTDAHSLSYNHLSEDLKYSDFGQEALLLDMSPLTPY